MPSESEFREVILISQNNYHFGIKIKSVLMVMICWVEYIAPVLLVLEFYRGEKHREKIVVPEVHVYDSQCVQETDQ